MHERVRRVLAALQEKGSTADIVELPAAAPTAADAATRLGCPVGAIANSLVFSVGGEPLLILASGAHRVDTRLVARLLGVGRGKIRRADPAYVLTVTGQEIGGVAPVGHPQPLPTLIDLTLDQHPHIWAGAGMPHTVFRTTFTELLKLTDGRPAVVATG